MSFILFSCSTKESIEISGKIRFATANYIVFSKLNPDTLILIDTIRLINNQYFMYDFMVDTPDFYSLDFDGKQRVNLILNNESVDVVVDGNSPFGYGRIYGSTDHDMLWEYKLLKDSFASTENYKFINSSMRNAYLRKDSVLLDSLKDIADRWYYERNYYLREFLKEYEPSLAHIQAFTILNDSISYDFKREFSLILIDKFPTSVQAKYFHKILQNE